MANVRSAAAPRFPGSAHDEKRRLGKVADGRRGRQQESIRFRGIKHIAGLRPRSEQLAPPPESNALPVWLANGITAIAGRSGIDTTSR
jgi:hypothetical protein